MKQSNLESEVENLKKQITTLEMEVIQIGRDLITTSERLALLKSSTERQINEVQIKCQTKKSQKIR